MLVVDVVVVIIMLTIVEKETMHLITRLGLPRSPREKKKIHTIVPSRQLKVFSFQRETSCPPQLNGAQWFRTAKNRDVSTSLDHNGS